MTINTTPAQRTADTSSFKINLAASAVMTKPSAVSGQIKLTSRWESR